MIRQLPDFAEKVPGPNVLENQTALFLRCESACRVQASSVYTNLGHKHEAYRLFIVYLSIFIYSFYSCIFIHLFIYLFIHLFIYFILLLYLFLHLFTSLFVHVFTSLLIVYLFIYLSSIHLFIHVSATTKVVPLESKHHIESSHRDWYPSAAGADQHL